MDVAVRITDSLEDTTHLKCPNCGEHGIDYIYIGDAGTRVGYLQVWCSECRKGIHVSRAVAPDNAKFASFDTDLSDTIPRYELLYE